MPSKLQWRQFLKVLNKRERNVFFVLSFLVVFSLVFLSINFYLKNTEVKPAQGGDYIEGVAGSPRFITPIYAAASDTDRDLTELIYSGLMKYDGKGGIIPDLAESYTVSEDGKIFEFYLKESLFWSDGEPLTVDDIIFTIKILQNPSVRSPLRANWLAVKVEKISELGIKFELSNPSAVFLENCTQEIIPEHVWKDVSYQNFPLSIYNLKPIGSGPYKLKELSLDNQGNIKSAELVPNPFYAGNTPNIQEITLLFFEDEEKLAKALKSGEIDGASASSTEEYQDLLKKGFSENQISLPRYFAIFFNAEKSKILIEDNVRLALNYATDKETLIKDVLSDRGEKVSSPILPGIYGFAEPKTEYNFDIEKAKTLLDEAGFVEKGDGSREKVVQKTPAFQFKKDLKLGSNNDDVSELQKCLAKDLEVYPEGTVSGYFGEKTKEAVIRFQEKYKDEILTPSGLTSGNGIVSKNTREKLNELCTAPSEEVLALSFTIATVDKPELVKVATEIAEMWRLAGINIEIDTFDVSTLEQDIIKPRNYEMLLFGEVLGQTPDPFPFWHSSQVEDPGLNLAGYSNDNCDKLLEENRQSLNEEKREEALEKFQNILINDAPAVFLYSPSYLYLVSDKVKGIDTVMITDSSKRFANVENWYINTKRVWK